ALGQTVFARMETRLNLQDISNLSTKISIIPLIYLLTFETVSTAFSRYRPPGGGYSTISP
ncbi:MAG: hypothetical protein KA260_04765, partial [Burkholderiales bacterium]|nr:hypothetical protein [Burkholderiales bacterium]